MIEEVMGRILILITDIHNCKAFNVSLITNKIVESEPSDIRHDKEKRKLDDRKPPDCYSHSYFTESVVC